MILQTQKILAGTGSHQNEQGPIVIKWKGIPMIKRHSVRASVREIVMKSKNRDVVKVGIIGEPHTGKTTQADTLAHLIHTIAKKELGIEFVVKQYKEEDFINMKDTIAKLKPANYIMKFGDLSFLKSEYGTKKIEELERSMSKIRHLPGGQDVKMILIYDYHYTKGLAPYLRQSDFKYFTGIGSSEKLNMEEIISPKFSRKMLYFKKISDIAPSTEKFSFKLGMTKVFTYNYRNPFIPLLFWNEDKARIIVSPTREWIDPICSTCSMADDTFKTTIDLDKLLEVGRRNYQGSFEVAVKLKLYNRGLNVYSDKQDSAIRFLDRVLEKGNVSLEDLVVRMGFKVRRTGKIRSLKSIDEILATDTANPQNNPELSLNPPLETEYNTIEPEMEDLDGRHTAEDIL